MLLLDGQTFSNAAEIARWIRNGPYHTLHRDYDVLDILADAGPAALIDEAVVQVVDEGPATSRAQMLAFLQLCPNSSTMMRTAYKRWASASWLDETTVSGTAFGSLVSAAAQSGFHRDLSVANAFLAWDNRYGVRTGWLLMTFYADPEHSGLVCLEELVTSGEQVDERTGSAIGVTLRNAPMPVVDRVAKALAGQSKESRIAFWEALLTVRTDDLAAIAPSLGLAPRQADAEKR